jgi:hypothetical protein
MSLKPISNRTLGFGVWLVLTALVGCGSSGSSSARHDGANPPDDDATPATGGEPGTGGAVPSTGGSGGQAGSGGAGGIVATGGATSSDAARADADRDGSLRDATRDGRDAAADVAMGDVAPDSVRPDVAVIDGNGLFLNGFFLIGTYMPGADEFQKWKSRGVNTVVEENGWVDESQGQTLQKMMTQWQNAAVKLGLKEIRRPMPTPSDDIGNTDLLAWMQEDEPDAYGNAESNLPICQKQYSDWKAIDPTRPVYINFGGSDVMGATSSREITTYKALIAASDWVSNDRYPVTGYLNEGATRNDLTLIGQPMDKIRGWTDKPQFCYIETSNQQFISGARGVTPDELRVQIWLSIVHGVRGYVFFPQVVGGSNTSNDGTPDAVAAEMTIQNGVVTQLAPVLQGEINPPSLGATVPAPLQVGWRDAPDGRYFIVVNPVGTAMASASITLTGVGAATSATVFNGSRQVPLTGGSLTDSFGAFGVNIYVVAK